jgi:thiol-disulfide isomerase/thioredoxin
MTSVRRFVLVVLAVAVLATVAYMTFGRTRTVPDATFGLLSGQKVTTTELRGKVYLVNFWATNCAPCISEMPKMTETYNKFKGKDFDFIAVAMHYDPPANVANYTQTQHCRSRLRWTRMVAWRGSSIKSARRRPPLLSIKTGGFSSGSLVNPIFPPCMP